MVAMLLADIHFCVPNNLQWVWRLFAVFGIITLFMTQFGSNLSWQTVAFTFVWRMQNENKSPACHHHALQLSICYP